VRKASATMVHARVRRSHGSSATRGHGKRPPSVRQRPSAPSARGARRGLRGGSTKLAQNAASTPACASARKWPTYVKWSNTSAVALPSATRARGSATMARLKAGPQIESEFAIAVLIDMYLVRSAAVVCDETKACVATETADVAPRMNLPARTSGRPNVGASA
jgi:hypothetical protein